MEGALAAEIEDWLREQGALPRRGDRPTVTQIPSAHDTFRFSFRRRLGCFVKRSRTEQARRDAPTEARVLAQIEDEQSLRALRPLAPRLAAFDPHRGLLATHQIAPAAPLRVCVEAGDMDPRLLGRLCGRALREVHDTLAGALKGALAWLPVKEPSVWHFPAHFEKTQPVEGYRDLFERATQPFWHLVPHAREMYKGATTAAYGDASWDNFVVTIEDDEPVVRVVDWETACRGDPAWDVAYFVAEASHSAAPARAEEVADAFERAYGPDAEAKRRGASYRPFALCRLAGQQRTLAAADALLRLAQESAEGSKEDAMRPLSPLAGRSTE